MNKLLKYEEFGMFILSIYLFNQLDFSFFTLLILFFLPDLGMVGYLINPQIGSFTYNLAHHKLIAVFIIISGSYINFDYMVLLGIVMFAHSSFDRIWGYGLKFPDNFKNTHLGFLGQKNEARVRIR